MAQVAGFLFCPQECALCKAWVVNSQWVPLCRTCDSSLDRFRGPVCVFCGIPVPGEVTRSTGICTECRRIPPPYDWARGWGPYEGNLRRLIYRFKFEGDVRLSIPLGELLAEAWANGPDNTRPDWLVPIPCHRRRKRSRGFDQSEKLARRLSRLLKVPMFRGLWRQKRTQPQPGLSQSERRRNLRGAFALRHPSRLEGRRVLIVDDVMTSGTTVSEAAKLLSAAGTKNISILVVARAPRRKIL